MSASEKEKVLDKREKSGSNGEGKGRKIFEKIRSVKHIEVIVAIICCVVLVLVYFGGSELSSNKKNNVITTTSESDKLLGDMEKILGSIKGVGKVNILINYSGGKRIEIASKVETVTKVDSDGTVYTITENRSPIIVSGNGESKPIILKEESAAIEGVIIVAEGADNAGVKLQLISAVKTLLDINPDKIKVFSMK